MAKNQPIILAEAVEIKIADSVFDAVRVIDTGEYGMHQGQILEPIGAAPNWFSTLGKPKGLNPKPLYEKGFIGLGKRVQYTKNGVRTVAVIYCLSDVRVVWRYFDRKGNEEAQKLIDLLTEDSLQDRFEQAWNERRTTEERNIWDKERIEGIRFRLTLTEAIAIYKENHAEELSENDKKWLFSNTTDAINKGIFDRRAQKLRVDLNVPKNANLRDHMTAQELWYVSSAEELTMRLILNEDMHPILAAKEALSRLIIPVQKRGTQPVNQPAE
jgi:hypothetical protein